MEHGEPYIEIQAGDSGVQHGVPGVHDNESEVQQCESKHFEAYFTEAIDATKQEDHVDETETNYIEAETNHDVEQEDHVDDVQIDSIDLMQHDKYEKGILEECNDSENEQEESITRNDNDENKDFRLSDGFDIGTDCVKDEQEGEAIPKEESRTDYEDSDELRSLPNDNEVEGSSTRRMNECWFNPTIDMDNPKFKTSNTFVMIHTLFSRLNIYMTIRYVHFL